MNSTPQWLRGYLRDPAAFTRHIPHLFVDWIPVTAPTGVAIVLGYVFLRRGCRALRHARLVDGARLVTVFVPSEVDPAGAQVLWANLVGLLRPAWRRAVGGQPHLVWEYVFDSEGATIRVWVPGPIPAGLVERAIEAAWPGARTTTDPPARNSLNVAVGGVLRLARSEALPIRVDHAADPLRALLGAPVALADGERAIVHILARPVTGSRVVKARRAARRLHNGAATRPAGRVLDALTPGPHTRTSRIALDPPTRLSTSAADRAIVAKAQMPQYETLIRYVVTTPAGPAGTERRAAVARIRGRAHAVASAFAVFSGHNYYRRRRLHHPGRAITERRLTQGDLLSITELAALAHLPTDEHFPGVQRAGARSVPPPPGITATASGVKPLGITDTAPARSIGLSAADSRHHTHILGATGSGKSELMARMILADAVDGRGVVVIDPKGDLVSDVLARLPKQAADRVALFDASSRSRPPCLNPLDGPRGDALRAADNLVSIFARVYAANWGPRTDDILRAGLLTLLNTTGDAPVLTDLPALLTSPAFRARAAKQVNDPILAGFWTWYEQLSDPARAQAIAPLMNKLRGLLMRPFVRDAIAAGPSTVDLTDSLNNRGICLVRLSKDALSTETAALLGSVIVGATWHAATARARLPQARRPDAGLYIDEAHHFLNLPYPIEDMLAEARGYRLSMTLAHQHLAQLPKDLAEGISANARNKIYFTASPEDARHLARHTQPRLTEYDLSHLAAFHAAARLVRAGGQAPAFTIATQKLPPPIPGRAKHIQRAAHKPAPQGSADVAKTATPPVNDPRRVA